MLGAFTNQIVKKWHNTIQNRKWRKRASHQKTSLQTSPHKQQHQVFKKYHLKKLLSNPKINQTIDHSNQSNFLSSQQTILKKMSGTQTNKTIKKQFYLKQGLTETTSTNSNQQSRKILPPKDKLNNSQRYSSHYLIIDDKKFIILKQLGSGKSGRVLLVIQSETGMVLAVKIIQKRKIKQEKLLQQLIRQLKIQAFLNHPNIIQFYGFFNDRDNFYILMELGSEGQLYSHIKDGKKMSQESTSFIIRSLLSAVSYLHHYNIIHRDIKPQNIVVVYGNIKLCDFGWCVHLKQSLRTTYCGTPLYFSPEIIVGMQYDEKVDIWAIGVLTYELLTGMTPFKIQQKDQLYKIVSYFTTQVTEDIIFNETKLNKYSIYFKEFVKAILKKDPRDRLNCKKLLQMPFIKRYQQLETCQELCKL